MLKQMADAREFFWFIPAAATDQRGEVKSPVTLR